MVTVLHVSDTQFGAEHRFGGDGVTVGDRRRSSGLAARLLGDLAHLKAGYGLAPDLVVTSGDLAEHAKPSEFEQVHDCLIELSEGLDLGRDRVVMVPGNHDVNWAKCQGYFLDCTGDDAEPVVLGPHHRWFGAADGCGGAVPRDRVRSGHEYGA